MLQILKYDLHHAHHGRFSGPAQHLGEPGARADGQAAAHHVADALVAEYVASGPGQHVLHQVQDHEQDDLLLGRVADVELAVGDGGREGLHGEGEARG